MKRLRDKLIADLTHPRPLTDQVVRALMDRCELQSNQIAAFLRERAADLEEAELDTIFSPMYTPSWSDRARYVEERERLDLSPAVLTAIIEDLSQGGLCAAYLYEEEMVSMPLPEVIIDRWVRRLHLEVTLPERISQAIEATIPTDHQAEVKALSGHADWHRDGREEILLAFLTGFARSGRFVPEKFEYLTGLIHTYRPRDVHHFAQQIEALLQSYHEENSEHFFDSHLKEAYGPAGGINPVRDTYGADRKRQMALATQLQHDLSEYLTTAP
ncbi:MAG: hypothetical protein OEW11_06980 [Nitrospirota bacterium]|nr:hypothetical protein [Nitrospirota bacterium]